jgi:hypothetical protein
MLFKQIRLNVASGGKGSGRYWVLILGMFGVDNPSLISEEFSNTKVFPVECAHILGLHEKWDILNYQQYRCRNLQVGQVGRHQLPCLIRGKD